MKTLAGIAKAAAAKAGRDPGAVKAELFQALSVSIRRNHARAVLRRWGDAWAAEWQTASAAQQVLTEQQWQ